MKKSFHIYLFSALLSISSIAENNNLGSLTLVTVEKNLSDLMTNSTLNNRQKSELRKTIVTQLQSLVDQGALSGPDHLFKALEIVKDATLSSQQTAPQLKKLEVLLEKKVHDALGQTNSNSTKLADTSVKKIPQALIKKLIKTLAEVSDYTLEIGKKIHSTKRGWMVIKNFTSNDIYALSEALETNTTLRNLTIPSLSSLHTDYGHGGRVYSEYLGLSEVKALGNALQKNRTLETLTIEIPSSEHVITLLELLEKSSLKRVKFEGVCIINDSEPKIWPTIRNTLLNNKNIIIDISRCDKNVNRPQDFNDILKNDGTFNRLIS